MERLAASIRERGSSSLGYLPMVAGGAYAVDTVANALLSNYDDYQTMFLVIVAVIGELWLAFYPS